MHEIITIFDDGGTEESEVPHLNKMKKSGTTSRLPTQSAKNAPLNPFLTADKVTISFTFLPSDFF